MRIEVRYRYDPTYEATKRAYFAYVDIKDDTFCGSGASFEEAKTRVLQNVRLAVGVSVPKPEEVEL